MKTYLDSMTGVEVVVGDILVHGQTLEKHNNRLKAVLKKARKINIALFPTYPSRPQPPAPVNTQIGHSRPGG